MAANRIEAGAWNWPAHGRPRHCPAADLFQPHERVGLERRGTESPNSLRIRRSGLDLHGVDAGLSQLAGQFDRFGQEAHVIVTGLVGPDRGA